MRTGTDLPVATDLQLKDKLQLGQIFRVLQLHDLRSVTLLKIALLTVFLVISGRWWFI